MCSFLRLTISPLRGVEAYFFEIACLETGADKGLPDDGGGRDAVDNPRNEDEIENKCSRSVDEGAR